MRKGRGKTIGRHQLANVQNERRVRDLEERARAAGLDVSGSVKQLQKRVKAAEARRSDDGPRTGEDVPPPGGWGAGRS